MRAPGDKRSTVPLIRISGGDVISSMPRWAVGGNSRSMVCAVAGLALKASTAATTNADALVSTNCLSKKVAGKGRQRFMVFIQRLRVMGTFIVNQ